MDSVKINQLGKQEIILLRAEIQAALDNIKSRHGMTELTLVGISYNVSSFTAKITGKVKNDISEDFEKTEAKFFAYTHGLPEDFIGYNFIMEGKFFTITHLETKNPKYPVIAKCKTTGRTYKFTVQRIKELLEKYRVIDINYKDEEANRIHD